MLSLLFIAHLCISAPLSADDRLIETVLGVQKRYAAVESVSAAFQQTYRAPGIEQVESGTLVMRKPGLMRWEYAVPEKKLFVADGRKTWLYTPADRQVMVREFTSADLRNTPLRFLLGQGDILKSYTPAWEREFTSKAADSLLVRLVPRIPDQDYRFIVIECDAKSFELRRIILREATDNTSEFLFSGMNLNVRTDRKQFEFKPPKGVEIIELDEK